MLKANARGNETFSSLCLTQEYSSLNVFGIGDGALLVTC